MSASHSLLVASDLPAHEPATAATAAAPWTRSKELIDLTMEDDGVRVDAHPPPMEMAQLAPPLHHPPQQHHGYWTFADGTMERLYEVECITARRESCRGTVEYRVKWLGYPDTESSWLTRQHLCDQGLRRMLHKFDTQRRLD